MRQNKSERCVGIDQDNDGGMAGTGRKIRDARAFDLLHETETCSGWNAPAIEQLWEKDRHRMTKYNHRVNDLPEDIRCPYLHAQGRPGCRAGRND